MVLNAAVRELVGKPRGRIALAICVVTLLAAGVSVMHALGSSESVRLTNHRVFICATTGKSFACDLKPGMKIPVISPFTRQATGYPAEACRWTRDGRPADKPTYVLLNSARGKPGEPTFCPDCDRLVVRMNPAPRPGMRPPPTREEYAAHEQQARGSADR